MMSVQKALDLQSPSNRTVASRLSVRQRFPPCRFRSVFRRRMPRPVATTWTFVMSPTISNIDVALLDHHTAHRRPRRGRFRPRVKGTEADVKCHPPPIGVSCSAGSLGISPLVGTARPAGEGDVDPRRQRHRIGSHLHQGKMEGKKTRGPIFPLNTAVSNNDSNERSPTKTRSDAR